MSTILIVDDEESILDVVSAILERNSYSVVKASNVDQAEAALDKGGIDAVIADVVLPGRGGLDLLMGIRTHSAHIPVIVMSGKVRTGADPFRHLATQFGARCILAKPFTAEELLEAVEGVLKSSCA